jgi:hypothetical protein
MAQKLTIVGGMKLRKRLIEKAADLRQKINAHHARLDNTSPTYKTDEAQTKVVAGWLQAHRDITALMEAISLSIQETNLKTKVEVVLDNKPITKSVAAWVLRRRELAPLDLQAILQLNDAPENRGLRELSMADPNDKTKLNVVKVVRHYDVVNRDKMKDLFAHEPSRIDAALETINATTELVGLPEYNEDTLLSA